MNGNVFKRTTLRQISSFILFEDGNPDVVESISYWERSEYKEVLNSHAILFFSSSVIFF